MNKFLFYMRERWAAYNCWDWGVSRTEWMWSALLTYLKKGK